MRRIWRPWWEWENVAAGFYETENEKINPFLARKLYAVFLRDTPRFQEAPDRVLNEWPNACEQFLSNESMNRIAWLGQASMCIATGIPSCYRGGFNLLSAEEQVIANSVAAVALNRWIENHA